MEQFLFGMELKLLGDSATWKARLELPALG